MRYEKMLPWQVRAAIEKNSPAVLSIGVLEYHSEHLSLGVDTQITEGALARLEEKHPEMVILPPFYYGTASYAVSSPEGKGTISIDSLAVCRLAEELFTNLLRVGFRNIHGLVYHQSENFAQGMPTDLAFRFAGRRAVFAFLEKQRGEGWWGDESMSNYYTENNPFEWIMIHKLTGEKAADHAGKVETSAMLAQHPDCVDMEKFTEATWFSRTAPQASAEFGETYVTAITERLEKLFF